jgi:hypothetical protein
MQLIWNARQLGQVLLPCRGVLAAHPVHGFVGTAQVTLVLLALRQSAE